MIGQVPKRAPIVYWGGKSKMWQYIQRSLPVHHTYIEPFVGGGAPFWLKENARKSVLNDRNNFVMNFYWVVKNKFDELDALVQSSLHSRNLYNHARKIYTKQANFSRVEQAWAFWYLTNFSLMQSLGSGSMACSRREGRRSLTVHFRKEQFVRQLSEKLKTTTLENKDALWVIDFYDWEQAFFFVDPPYINTDCGHYAGYTADDFAKLLRTLSTIKGKFLLTCYPNDVLFAAIAEFKYHYHIIDMPKDAGTFNAGTKVMKQEVMVANYPFNPFVQVVTCRELCFG